MIGDDFGTVKCCHLPGAFDVQVAYGDQVHAIQCRVLLGVKPAKVADTNDGCA